MQSSIFETWLQCFLLLFTFYLLLMKKKDYLILWLTNRSTKSHAVCSFLQNTSSWLIFNGTNKLWRHIFDLINLTYFNLNMNTYSYIGACDLRGHFVSHYSVFSLFSLFSLCISLHLAHLWPSLVINLLNQFCVFSVVSY